MRPVLFAALSALAGCSFIDTQRGAQYLCQRDAGDPAAQCPGGWVCGYSGYCIDPASPRTYACAADGDCVGGWHCGLAHLCLDPADPQPYDCVSDHDCSGDWHCGPAGQCYELATATNVLCRPAGTEDGGSDCAPGWRCGLNGQCHDRDAGTDYQCANDLDCEQLWRCGPDGRCVDAHLDALRPNDTFGSPGSQLINPVLPTATPDLVASSNAHSLDSCGTSATLSSASLVSKGELTKWQRYAGFYNGLPVDCPDGGVFSAARTLSSEVIHVSLEGGSPVAVTDDGPDTWALMADGGLWRVSYDFRTRLSAQQPIPPPFAPVGLKAIESSRGALLVFDSQRVAVLRMGGTWDLTPPVPQALDGGGALIDVAMATVNGTEVVFAGSRLGLHSLANPGGSLVLGTWALPWRDCKAQVAVTNLQVVAGSTNLNSPMSYLAAQTVDTVSPGRSGGLMMFAAAADGGVPGPACPSLVPAYVAYGQPTYLVPVGNACPICNPGDRSELWSALAEDGGVQVVGRCFVDGGVTAAVGDICLGGPAAGCGLTCSLFSGSGARGPLSAKARFSRASSSFLSAVDELGGLWMAEAGHGAVFRPETLSAVPETSAGELARPFVSVAPTGIEPEWGGSRMVVAPGIFELSGAGFSWLTNSQMGIDAVVDGRPTWLFTRGSLNGPVVSFVIDTRGHGVPLESRSFGLVALASSGLSAPLRAAACDTGDGGTRLLVGSGDALSAADVSVSADGGLVPASQAELGKLPTLRFALAPVPRADITSLIALPPDSAAHSGAGYALGYLIATGRIFRVRADNPVVWRADEITIEPAEAAAVWKDGARARVGFRDGAVFALPSRVALAPALSTASVVLDFQNVCGHTFAVTGQELYHLVVTSSSAQGSWVRVPLVAADAGLDQPIGRLQSDGQGLLLYRQRGVVERLTGITCLPAE